MGIGKTAGLVAAAELHWSEVQRQRAWDEIGAGLLFWGCGGGLRYAMIPEPQWLLLDFASFPLD